MRHIFIVNPAAGHRDSTTELCDEIRRAVGDRIHEIHRTEHPGHAHTLTDTLAAQYAPEICRFYSCGGDGTLCEVVNGAMGHANAEVACVPCGTGNDFVKIFDKRECLRDFAAQIDGQALPLDVLAVNDHYSINICNSGFDARIAQWTHENKRKLPVSGMLAYVISVIVNFFKKINTPYTLEIDGERQEGEYAIIVAANARFYGGGFYAVPEAEPDDGLLDVIYVPRVSRLTLLRCIGKFAVGRHADIPHLIHHTQARELRLTMPAPEALSRDGEITMEQQVNIRIIRGGLMFVQPLGASIIRHNAAAAVE